MNSILIVDDDKDFCEALAVGLNKRGKEVRVAHDIQGALKTADEFNPEGVVIDLKIEHESGLELIPKLLEIEPQTRIVVLTGYASIATAVEAIKLGAIHYLTKPVSMEDIIAAFHKQEGNPSIPVEPEPFTLSAYERERILSVLERNKYNISATARELGLHRRTLQRKLDKLK